MEEFGEEVDAEVFLRMIYEDVQGFAYLDSLAGEPRSYYIPQFLTDLIEEATWSLGGNLYCTTNTFTDGRIEHYTDAEGKRKIKTGRLKENAKEGRALYCDADTAHPDVFRLKPSIIVESSPGRYQTWWLLDDVYPAVRIALASRQIAYAHNHQGADISSSSLTKLLRVPGSRNEKRNRETGDYVHPGLPTVTAWDTGARYTLSEIEEVYEDIDFIRNLLGEREEVELPEVEHLPKFTDLYNAMPETSPTGVDLVAMIETSGWLDEEGKNRPGPTGDRSRWRYRLICELMRTGYSNEETLVLAWAAKSSDKWKSDPRGQRGLWGEILKARIEINGEQGEGLDAIEPDHLYQETEIGIPLLDDQERESLKGEVHFINRYSAWVQSRLKRANMPYHRLNAWMVLSVAYAELTKIPDESSDYPLNVWVLALGETATGKTQASDMMYEVLQHVHEDGFWGAEGVGIGGNATPTALNKVLIDRDAKVSVFHTDEAHGTLNQIQKAEYQAGSLELYTYLYDGRVPKFQRSTNDSSNQDATTIFNMWLLGPPRQVTDAIPTGWFESGFMGRFMLAIGDPPDDSSDKVKVRRREGDLSSKRLDPFVAQFAEEVIANREIFEGRGLPYLEETEPFLARISFAVETIIKFSKAHHSLSGPLYQASRRFEKHIRKAAWLLALSEGSAYVTLRHGLIAIEAAEGWLSALVEVAGQVSTNPYAQQATEIERTIAENGNWMPTAKINRKFPGIERRARAELIADLAAQNRIKADTRNGIPGYRTAD